MGWDWPNGKPHPKNILSLMTPVTDPIQILHGGIDLVEPGALGPAGRGETVPDHGRGARCRVPGAKKRSLWCVVLWRWEQVGRAALHSRRAHRPWSKKSASFRAFLSANVAVTHARSKDARLHSSAPASLPVGGRQGTAPLARPTFSLFLRRHRDPWDLRNPHVACRYRQASLPVVRYDPIDLAPRSIRLYAVGRLVKERAYRAQSSWTDR
jgi:hypothetical protein